MDVWTFIWLLVILKIPVVMLFLIVRWAVRQTPRPRRSRTAASDLASVRATPTGREHRSRARPGAARTAVCGSPRPRGRAPERSRRAPPPRVTRSALSAVVGRHRRRAGRPAYAGYGSADVAR